MNGYLYQPFKATDLNVNPLYDFDESIEPESFCKLFVSLGPSGKRFDTFSELAESNDALLALVPYERTTLTIFAPQSEFYRILELWQLPATAVRGTLCDRRNGFHHMRFDDHLCICYELSTSHARREIASIIAIQIVDVRTHVSKTIVLIPTVFYKSIVEMPGQYRDYQDQSHWSMIHFLVIELAMKSWRWRRTELVRDSYKHERALDESTGKTLDAHIINDASDVILDLNEALGEMKEHKRLICDIRTYLNKHGDNMVDAITSWASMAINNVEKNVNTFTSYKKDLEERRARAVVSMNALTASYLYKNMIAMRRISKQSQAELRSAQKQAIAAQSSAKSMAMIAYIGMLYLPATSLATIFALPFFTLENAHDLGNMNELWVYVVVVLTITLLTFILPIVLPKIWNSIRSYMRQSSLPEDDQVEDQETFEDPTLEPPPYSFPADILEQEVAQLFPDKYVPRKKTTSESERQDAEDGTESKQDVIDAADEPASEDKSESRKDFIDKVLRSAITKNTT